MQTSQLQVWYLNVVSGRRSSKWIMWAEDGKVFVSEIVAIQEIANIKNAVLEKESDGVKIECDTKTRRAMQEWLLPYEI